jgi:hypothetical protein
MARASIVTYGWEDVRTERDGQVENPCRRAFDLGHSGGERNEWVDLLLGNDALSQLGCFSVQYNDAGVGSFSTTPTTSEESPQGKAGYIVNYETLSIPAFSMMHVDVFVPKFGGQNPGHMVEPSPKVMADKGVSIGRLFLPSRVTGGTHRFPLTNFSSSTQFIPAGMVVGKILSVDKVLDENRESDPTAVSTEPSL